MIIKSIKPTVRISIPSEVHVEIFTSFGFFFLQCRCLINHESIWRHWYYLKPWIVGFLNESGYDDIVNIPVSIAHPCVPFLAIIPLNIYRIPSLNLAAQFAICNLTYEVSLVPEFLECFFCFNLV